MFSLINGLNPKVYFVAIAVFGVLLVGGYIGYLKNDLKNKEQKLEKTSNDLVEQKNINDLTIKAYEQTLEIEKEKNTFEITTQKEKEPLIKISEKVKQEVEKVKKYKEVKQDEKECPKLGIFKL